MEDIKNAMVSVCMITYNQEAYIAKAIESVLMQKCSFSYELVIGEDCSTDNTLRICNEYMSKNPNVIKVLHRNPNLGMSLNFQNTLLTCQSKYVAICEGDDYWTDPYKLQKQVDFLESNLGFSFCFHNAVRIFENSNLKPRLFNSLEESHYHNFESLVNRKWFIATASIVFRNSGIYIPSWFQNAQNGDLLLELLLAKEGPFYYLPDVMSVYRTHRDSISSKLMFNNLKLIDSLIYLFQKTKELYPPNYHLVFENRILQLVNEKKTEMQHLDYPVLKFFNLKTYKRILGKMLNIQRRMID